MSSLRRTAWRVAGLSSAMGALAVSGRIFIYLAFGLIATLALTGTFGSPRYQEPAQAVLAILLGRTPPRKPISSRGKPVSRPGSQRATISSSPKPKP